MQLGGGAGRRKRENERKERGGGKKGRGESREKEKEKGKEKGDWGGGQIGGRKIRRDPWNCAGIAGGGNSGAFAFSSQWLPYKTASEAKVIK